MDWDKLQKAYETIKDGIATRIDGEGWKVYKAGTIIRIDIED
jgi:hypothetical protein